ncbi:MAG: sugar porter family MFS transporter [Gammaproteobacteria bacterium]|nr:sugar porter family MFS transporter [Gammaproteobacteria bacterium]NND47517.1 sugar porter family MFS transporter [Woeseiaceae bacterium]NNL44589.1 sugar porter family MFS transporter [Woeseiaceae bacterium]
MQKSTRFTVTVALIVALGGFLMGFDASVISGVVGFIETEFQLSKIQLGWSVASLTLTATIAMMVAGPLSDRLGRRPVLKLAAALFAVSAVASAVAPSFLFLVIARMIGGFGVGAALIIAPMYIAEIAPAEIRGRMVSFNQLNIVIGISVAFFSNYLILMLGQSDIAWVESLRFAEWNWRWMLGVETLPAVLYFFALLIVPESPRWLAMHGRDEEALQVFEKVGGPEQAKADLAVVHASLSAEAEQQGSSIRQLFQPAMKLVLTIGISVAILQQITGINSVFFYAPMIFEQSGIGTDASFMQAILVGIVNLVFTIAAMALIDKLGRRPLLSFGLTGIAVCMFTLSYGFGSATYTLTAESIDSLPALVDRDSISQLQDVSYDSDVAFRRAVSAAIGADSFKQHESSLVSAAIDMNPTLILFGILGFVASFAISLGPVMWVLFSELFPNQLRGLAISFAGLINSAVSFGVQLVFPWELENLGNSGTFLIYGLFAVVGLVVIMRILPETKGRTLEELETILVRS